jgi:hypothetical protein
MPDYIKGHDASGRAEIREAPWEPGIGPGEAGPVKKAPAKDWLAEPAIIKFFNAIWTISNEARQPREQVWDNGWDLYNGVYDWSSKAWWQSKANIPKVRPAVDRATGVFRRSLLRLRQFYSIEAESRIGKQKGLFTMQLLDYWLSQAGAIPQLVDALKTGVLTSTIILKVWWQTVRDRQPTVVEREIEEQIQEFGVTTGLRNVTKRGIEFKDAVVGKLGFAAVDPYNFWVVPRTNKRMVIERTYSTFAEIQKLIEKKVYDKDAIDKIKSAQLNQKLEKDKEDQRAGEAPTMDGGYLHNLELFHFWGDIYNPDGEVVMEDARFSMCGKDTLLKLPSANPFFHHTPPYRFGSPYRVPFSSYDRGVVEDVAEIARSITELSNLIFDGAKFDALKAFEIDADALDDPSDASGGIYPGRGLITRSSRVGPNAKAVTTIEVGKVPAEAMNALNMYNSFFQEGTYITEFISGLPSSGARTATEVSGKAQQAFGGLDEAAWNAEISVFEPVIDLAAKVIYQFHNDYTLPRLVENFPEVSALLLGMDAEERYAIMVGGFNFRARGLSSMIEKQQHMADVERVLTLLSHIPGLLEGLSREGLLEEIVSTLWWNPQKLLINQATPAVTTFGPQGPQQNATPMMMPQGNTPAQQFSAEQGAAMGGATNNPMAAGAASPANAPGRERQTMQQVLQMIQGGRR